MHKFDPRNYSMLLGEERYKELNPVKFLRSNGLLSGMCIADIGCGPGFFTRAAADIVGENGMVYAIDTQEEMLDEIRKRGEGKNVTVLKSDENHIPVEDGICDMALLAFVLHEALDKGMFLKEVKRILKIGGSLLLIDWEKKIEDKGPPCEERIERKEAERLVELSGFEMKGWENLNGSHYRITGMAL